MPKSAKSRAEVSTVTKMACTLASIANAAPSVKGFLEKREISHALEMIEALSRMRAEYLELAAQLNDELTERVK